jgi:hypothetical protein
MWKYISLMIVGLFLFKWHYFKFIINFTHIHMHCVQKIENNKILSVLKLFSCRFFDQRNYNYNFCK